MLLKSAINSNKVKNVNIYYGEDELFVRGFIRKCAVSFTENRRQAETALLDTLSHTRVLKLNLVFHSSLIDFFYICTFFFLFYWKSNVCESEMFFVLWTQ